MTFGSDFQTTCSQCNLYVVGITGKGQVTLSWILSHSSNTRVDVLHSTATIAYQTGGQYVRYIFRSLPKLDQFLYDLFKKKQRKSQSRHRKWR